MRAVIQRVSKASVTVNGECLSKINQGLLILLGVEEDDNTEDALWLSRKIAQLRIFNDADGLMNKSVQDINGECLVISQFTLFAQCKKGNRPSYVRAAKPNIAAPKYEEFVQLLQKHITKMVQQGEFGADMKVDLLNDGPVTLFIDTKEKDL